MAASGRSDVEALSRSFRSRILLLVLLLGLGLGAALWTGLRDAGKGAPEDRRRIMVVTDSGAIGQFDVLERAGFQIEVESVASWEDQAKIELPDTKATGVGLVLELADHRGVALLLFEDPSAFDFTGLAIEPALDTIERLPERNYLALSVGDYSFPHQLTVSDIGEHPLIRLPGYGALLTIFRQPLISARDNQDRPTIEELEYESAIRTGRRMVEASSELTRNIASKRAALERSLRDGSGARTMLPTLSTGSPIPTPDGGIVVFHHELVFFSDDARSFGLEAGPQMQLSWLGPTAVAAGLESGDFVLEPCPSLAGGALNMADNPRIETAADGSAVVIGLDDGDATLWRKTADLGCQWEPVAAIERAELEGIELAPRLTGGDRTLAARIQRDEWGSQLMVWALPGGEGGGEGGELAQLIVDQDDRRFTASTFIDDRHLAVASDELSYPMGTQARVDVVDRLRPGVLLRIPEELFIEGQTVRELVALAPASEAAGPTLLLSAEDRAGQVQLIRVGIHAEAWGAFTNVDGPIVSLTAEQLDKAVLATVNNLTALSVGPDASLALYSFRVSGAPAELALLDLETGARRQLTHNAVRDYLPRVAADGSYLTFVSLMQVNLSSPPFSVPRALALTPTPTK